MNMVKQENKWRATMPEYRIESHLKELMKARDVVVSDVVYGTHLSDPTVRRWLNNQIKRIDESTVARLCKFLDCKRDDLYTVIETPDE